MAAFNWMEVEMMQGGKGRDKKGGVGKFNEEH